jgi:FlaA1/EpsC-like NDP-sugar epimerase
VNDYIAASSRLLAEQSEHLERELASVPEIVIWGAGQTTLTLLANAPLGGAKVLAIADSNPRYHGRTLGGIPVISPEQLRRFQVPIVIGSLISQAPILRRIRELGLPNRTITLEPPNESPAEPANTRTH